MPSKNYDAIARELLVRCASGKGLGKFELRDAAWCLWHSTPALAESPAIKIILTSLQNSNDKRALRSYASALLEKFDPEASGFSEIAALLALKAFDMGDPWAHLQKTFEIFDPRTGPNKITEAAMSTRTSPTNVLAKHGVGALDATSGYAKHCGAIILHELAFNRRLKALDRLKFIKDVALKTDSELIFDDHGPLVANALILPFGNEMPEESIQKEYLHLLMRLFKDPRLHPGRWTRMPDAEKIVKRWLARASLVQFLDVVDKVAIERMWTFRRAFWEAVYSNDLIEDAWVAFDWRGASVAKEAFGSQLPFARLNGAQEGQAVLLLRLRHGVVAEWSHNGRCVIWNDAEDRRAPRMYLGKYEAHGLRDAEATDTLTGWVFAISHMGSQTYSWQKKVAEKIYRMTGVMISQRDYEIR